MSDLSISGFIRDEVILPRLGQRDLLVVYDEADRYRKLCLALETPLRRVIDASASSIESREAALETLQEMGRTSASVRQLLVYVPAPAPRDDSDRQRDPFALYAAAGGLFPNPMDDGDAWISLCKKAKPGYEHEIERIFAANPNPTFEVIDAIGGGAGWPQLQALLHVESSSDVVFALLAPSKAEKEALKEGVWQDEARTLLKTALGLELRTKGKTLPSIADEVWKYILFSEFAFDLPDPLPGALASVPHAPQDVRGFIYSLCERLRNDQRARPAYIERAEELEADLDLPVHFDESTDLGVVDTLPFEARRQLALARTALLAGDEETCAALLARRESSLWAQLEGNQAEWQSLEAAAALLRACRAADESFSAVSPSQEKLFDLYAGDLYRLDAAQRKMEQALDELVHKDEDVQALRTECRKRYQQTAGKVQAEFVHQLEKSGWPVSGRLSTLELFDRKVAPILQQGGQRVALICIDALRYELGVELADFLRKEGQVDLGAACAPLPTITEVGMAALLPAAAANLRLRARGDGFQVVWGDKPLENVASRMELLRDHYGDRFAHQRLGDFIESGAGALKPEVELLLLRSNEMDSQFENDPAAALSQVSRTFRQLRGALRKLSAAGFASVIVATDHGFLLNSAPPTGAKCSAPKWKGPETHGRLRLGDGQADAANFALPAGFVGVKGDFAQVAGPRALVSYVAGAHYLHGGASLQECVVPVLTVKLRKQASSEGAARPQISLALKRGGKRITGRLPSIEISMQQGDLFTQDAIELVLEARDAQEKVVGEATTGGVVDQSTRIISLASGQSVSVTLRMAEDFAGKFRVSARDPNTQKQFAMLDLETDYMT